MLFFNVKSYVFIRLLSFTINFFDDYLWTRYAHFETFTTHVFNQYAKLQLAAAAKEAGWSEWGGTPGWC